jgi:hypothetical protein
MHEIRVSVMSPEAADDDVAELSAAGEPDRLCHRRGGRLEPAHRARRDRTSVVIGARSLAQALARAEQLLEQY